MSERYREYGYTEIEVHCWNPLCLAYAVRFASALLAVGHYAPDGSFVETDVTYDDGDGCWSCHEPLLPISHLDRPPSSWG